MRVPHSKRSLRSSDKVARPRTVTKLKGGRSSSQHNATRGSRTMALPLTVSAEVMNTMSSPSRSTQTGATWGDPSRRITASFAVRAGLASTNSRHHPSGASLYATSCGASAGEVDVGRIHGAGAAIGCGLVLPVQVRVRDHLLRRRCSVRREVLGGVGVAHERDVIPPHERTMERRTDTCVGLRARHDETADPAFGEAILEVGVLERVTELLVHERLGLVANELRDVLPVVGVALEPIAFVLHPH